jgi:hypothetical protein
MEAPDAQRFVFRHGVAEQYFGGMPLFRRQVLDVMQHGLPCLIIISISRRFSALVRHLGREKIRE